MRLRFALGAVALWLCACGSGSPNNMPTPQVPKVPDTSKDGGTTVSPGCTPTTCADHGRACGQLDDGCGGVLECGTCGTGEQCNPAGACESIPSSCTPKTCAELSATCGSRDNGCGGVLSCGTCATGQRCGTNSTCEPIPTNCTPTTCAAQSATCGSIPDGCGGTLSCGSCDNGSACGVDHACHATGPAGGSTVWTTIRPERLTTVTADLSGTLFAAAYEDGAGGSEVQRFTAAGAFTNLMHVTDSLSYLVANPTLDQIIMSGEDDSHLGPPPHDVLTTNKALSSTPKSITGGLDESFFHVYAASSFGTIGLFRNDTSWGRFQVFNSDGSEVFELDFQDKFWIYGSGFDANGNAIFGGALSGPITIGGQTFGTANRTVPAVFKVSPNGTLIWGRTLDVDGKVAQLGVTTAGTAVALVRHEAALSFAGSSVSGGAGLSLVVYENSGAERVGSAVASGPTTLAYLAVDPMGRAFVAYGKPSCDSTTVVKLNLAGSKEWTRTLAGMPACSQTGSSTSGLTVSNHAPVLSGFFDKPFDFGSGLVTPQGTDGFLMELQP